VAEASKIRRMDAEAIAGRLAKSVPDRDPPADPTRAGGRAAVAAALRFAHGAPEVLLIRRARRRNDRWSGQVAFPGGREGPGDGDLLATALRETREEVGLRLSRCAQLLGRMPPQPTATRRGTAALTIAPFVFAITREEPISLGPEADDYFWLPLDRAASGELDGRHRHWTGPVPMRFPCWRYRGEVVWGLTYAMLKRFLKILTAE